MKTSTPTSSARQPTQLSVHELPADFTVPAPKYRRQAWLALVALLAFGLVYVSLATWFTFTSYRLLSGLSGGNNTLVSLAAGVAAGFLAVFMWKALFFKRHKVDAHLIELKKGDEPELFAFLYDLADRLKAPRPYRVFVSAEVNAAVFYDLTLFNFIVPTKKNLIIGLGLVNALNRHELEAVLAHEFGHFAQRSMAVGRWASFAEQIARQVVNKRDVLDSLLMAISNIDIRIAWVGWIMRTIVWSIRSLIETLFSWVVILQRALSREMEFQADLVAVSATGSDALINGLYRCQTADEDWQQSLSFAEDQAQKQRKLTDIYEIQSRTSELLARITNEPDRGTVPEADGVQAATRRIFTRQLAQPPRMWSTHPSNVDREENAKRIYVTAPGDDRSAWSVFRDPQSLRQKVTAHLLAGLPDEFELQPLSESLKELDKQFEQPAFDARYQGMYLGRRTSLTAKAPVEMFSDPPTQDDLGTQLSSLYSEDLQTLIESRRNLNEHADALEAIQHGVSDASSDSYEYEGECYSHRQLPKLIARVKADRDAVDEALSAHDRNIRTTYNTAARSVAHGWQEYHHGLVSLLHYAEHSEADLNDALGHFSNTVGIATATGRVSGKSLKRVLASADDLYHVMKKLDTQANATQPPPAVLTEMSVESWREAIPKLELPGPTRENLGQWVDAVGSWAASFLAPMGLLQRTALNHLLQTEDQIAFLLDQPELIVQAPQAPSIPEFYSIRPIGSERKRQKKLDWLARFALADGVVPMLARTSVAASILGGVIAAGVMTGRATVVVYNGLHTNIRVNVGGKQVQLPAGKHERIRIPASLDTPVQAWSGDELIEEFSPSVDGAFRTYVYNVAAAAPLIEWTAVYGNIAPREPTVVGFKRWHHARTDFVFDEPPKTLKTKSSGGTRTVLERGPIMLPFQELALVVSDSSRKSAIENHVLWDDEESPYFSQWLTAAASIPDGFAILNSRATRDPLNASVLRMMQETVAEGDREALLSTHQRLRAEYPDDPNMQYVAIRAMPDGDGQDEAFLQAAASWPNNVFLAHAAAYVRCSQQEWDAAANLFAIVLSRRNPMYAGAAVETARIRRLLDYPERPDLRDLMQSDVFNMIYDIELGQNLGSSPMRAFSMIRRREFNEAYRIATQPDAPASILILLAASDGAPPEWKVEALKIAIDEIDDTSLLYYLGAIAQQSGGDTATYTDAAAKLLAPDDHTFHASATQVIQEGGTDDIQPHLVGLSTARQGVIYALATMLRGDDAPSEWRAASQAMLFANEGPAL